MGAQAGAGITLDAFELVLCEPGRFSGPPEVVWAGALEASTTVAAALAKAGRLYLSAPPRLDELDAWYRTRLPDPLPEGRLVLRFPGLATLADVWLGGEPLFTSENMFVENAVDVPAATRPGAELVLRFRALAPHLAMRRPRPRWRTRLVDQQQLRWVRTSLIGRTPGFCPSVPVVGPFRPIRLETHQGARVREARIDARPVASGGEVTVSLTVEGDGLASASATLVVEGPAGSGSVPLSSRASDGRVRLQGVLAISDVARWWPHTHGEQPRSRARVVGLGPEIDLGHVAFRDLAVDRDQDGKGFGLVVNGAAVFCRGACWTTDDLLTLGSDDLRAALETARKAGMNMLRLPGIAAYETAEFHELCDELGILVFQDFMFANMDYPASDPAWIASVEAEVRGVLARIGSRPSTAVLCGGSEVEQQAAMLGVSRELWQSPLVSEVLPRLSAELAPSVPYVSGSPSGGDLPFQTDEGLTHYYGAAAYLRPLDDVRRSRVRFASECLAFSNPPRRETIERLLGDLERPPHHPRWKERVPRDRGVGWDFEDVRDHWVHALFGVDPASVRYGDPERYLALGRAAVGEVIEATLSEFRREGSSCRGALVLLHKDYWDGAGWGLVDAQGLVKSAYHHVKRVSQPLALLVTDEGLNGVFFHVVNEQPRALHADLEVTLYRSSEVVVARATKALTLEPRATRAVRVEAMLEHFLDTAYAYRFGPPGHDLVVGRLEVAGAVVASAFHLPLGRGRPVELDLGLAAELETRGERLGVRVTTRRFAQNVTLDVPGYEPEDDSFHLEPGGSRFVPLEPRRDAPAAPRGTVSALNSATNVTVRSSG